MEDHWTRSIMNQIIYFFSLTLLILMLVSQVFSAQKSAHSLCFSVPCANCKQLDKFPFSRQHPLNIVLRQQLSINFFSVSSIDSTSINFQFSQKQFFFLPLPEIYLATSSTKINFHGIWQNHSSRRAKLLASLKSLQLPTSNLFGQAKNIRLLVKFLIWAQQLDPSNLQKLPPANFSRHNSLHQSTNYKQSTFNI